MKHLSRKIITIILAVVMCASMCSTAFAASPEIDVTNSSFGSYDQIQVAIDSYNSLDNEAKAVFDQFLATDSQLLEFHTTYVDSSYSVSAASKSTNATYATAAADPVSILTAELALLNLPSAVDYALKAMASGMVAALADGALPFGDIILAAAAASAVVVIAANWSSVSPKFNGIALAFKKAFVSAADAVVSAFSSLLEDVNYQVNNSVTVRGKQVTINGFTYNCTTQAATLTISQQTGKSYFPAVLVGGTLYVDAQHNIGAAGAKVIASANLRYVGAWATNASYARGVCGGDSAPWHDYHDSSEGYFYHYHHVHFKNFHCWYL